MRLIFLVLFSYCFFAKSQTDSVKLGVDTCTYIASWYYPSDYLESISEVVIDTSGHNNSIGTISIYNIPPCNKSSCNVFVMTECETQEFHFIIYNRWGEVEYETTTPGNGWCAYNKVDGVYIWQIEGIYLSGEKFKFRGHFHLLKDTGEIE